MCVRKKIVSTFIASYFSIVLYFSFSTKSLAWYHQPFSVHKRRGFPRSRYSSRSGKVRNHVGNFLRSGRFAKSHELPAERRKLEKRRNMYRPRASPLPLSPRQSWEASWLPPLLLRLISRYLESLLVRLERCDIRKDRVIKISDNNAANLKYYDYKYIN